MSTFSLGVIGSHARGKKIKEGAGGCGEGKGSAMPAVADAGTPHTQPLPSPMTQQLKDLAIRDVRRRIVLAKPVSRGAAHHLRPGHDMDVDYYMALKAAWLARVAGEDTEDGVWDVPQSEVLASYRYLRTTSRTSAMLV